MTANQIAWWNTQEQIRSHMQNEMNERNKNSITESLGDEQNRISNQRMKNDFVLGTQGNAINQQQADTAARRATQDYDIGKRTTANQAQANVNQALRNAQDYEIGTRANQIKAADVSNNFIIGQGTVKNQSIRNAQDFAIGKMQQATNVRMADAAMLSAGAQVGKLNPAGVVVALTAPYMQEGAKAGADKVKQTYTDLKKDKSDKFVPRRPETQFLKASRSSSNSNSNKSKSTKTTILRPLRGFPR